VGEWVGVVGGLRVWEVGGNEKREQEVRRGVYGSRGLGRVGESRG
jgi:hypothetical protein